MPPLYAFRCSDCGLEIDRPVLHPEFPSPCCGAPLRRLYRVAFHRSMPEHWNHSVGAYVSNHQEFKDALKRKGDEASERLGTEHRYVEADIRNAGQTDDGREDIERGNRGSGRDESKRRIFTP
jgi:hypothetical protein